MGEYLKFAITALRYLPILLVGTKIDLGSNKDTLKKLEEQGLSWYQSEQTKEMQQLKKLVLLSTWNVQHWSKKA